MKHSAMILAKLRIERQLMLELFLCQPRNFAFYADACCKLHNLPHFLRYCGVLGMYHIESLLKIASIYDCV